MIRVSKTIVSRIACLAVLLLETKRKMAAGHISRAYPGTLPEAKQLSANFPRTFPTFINDGKGGEPVGRMVAGKPATLDLRAGTGCARVRPVGGESGGNARRFIGGLAALLAGLLVPAGQADPAASRTPSSPANSNSREAGIVRLPPIFVTGERILFEGDVTIDGARWRSRDLKVPAWEDYAYIIAAEYGAGYPERHLVFINRSVQGDKMEALAERWQKDALALKPDVISILIGVNDLVPGFPHNRADIRKFEQGYDELLAGTIKANPRIKLLLCAPFVLPGKYTTPRWNDWVDLIGRMESAVDELGVKYRVPVVHFQKMFKPSVPTGTAAHKIPEVELPTYAEHLQMADAWIHAYRDYYDPPREAKDRK